MRILYVGDVVGRSGRRIVEDKLPSLRVDFRLDAIVVNGENAAGGFGLTKAIADDFFAAGTDLITLGNHSFDQRELIAQIDGEPRIVRPLNMMGKVPGRGVGEVTTPRGKKLVVIQILCRLFMKLYEDPFKHLDAVLAKLFLGGNAHAIMVDLHGEATSEKNSLAHYLDGRVSFVAGTHTHVPTSDARILAGGTGYITDIGMTGDYDSVIGMKKEIAVNRWLTELPGPRLEPAGGPATLSGVLVETDDKTGLTKEIAPLFVNAPFGKAIFAN